MNKLTISVAALALAISSYGQVNDSTYVTENAIKAYESHKNLYEIVIRAEDMIFQLDVDSGGGFILDGISGFYKELLVEIIKLAAKTEINGEDIDAQDYYDRYLPCENCDELD